MPNVECLLTLNGRLLMIEADDGRWVPIQSAVTKGESPLEACSREVTRLTGLHVSPSCAGVVYAVEDSEHDYTLVFVADATAEGSESLSKALRWVDLHGIKHRDDVPALHRELVPLLLTADGPLVVILDNDGPEPLLKESAPIAHARLSPLVFAIAQ